ncbi:branched-chain amino acid transport system permease protein [Octadecabacter temperatus]|uniref:High-affinity branched-chain amino acid transport system permease protein LivH n=1 Tax=Octadecabacter temperatus TaxID=1458307 RepID=A0A0K0Y4Y1_9RHOB|nr:branched-chain amino acid ABC transporter permease [Octadecabacter temperatus]AKS46014.1 High-affinity branched-chain amino acid transport system permease protein LivH [Octadecabacter temperatus]SIO05699.1 branched-chain amino acid transport system permease protein [Octadecabacter temperatus]
MWEFVNYYFIPGLVLGCIYALGAIGITLTFGILRFANFAHGEIMMSGAYLTWTVMAIAAGAGLTLHPLVAMVPAAFLVILLFLGTDKFFYKPFRKEDTIKVVMASFGMMLIIRSAVQMIWGPNQITFVRGIAKPNATLSEITSNMGLQILMPNKHLFIFAGTIVLVVALGYLLNRTRIGKAMRAVSDSPDLAHVTGINVDKVINATWIVGGICATAAGVFLVMDTQMLETTMGFRMLLPMFAAAILGGIGKPYGAVAGGLIIGLAEELSAYPWIGDAPLLSPGYKTGVAFAIMVIMLIVRPQGLFKGRSF